MEISVITLFPEIFPRVLNSSILQRAQNKGLVKYNLINLRDYGETKHRIVDDKPYGGGVGMVLRADILAKALKSIRQKTKDSQISREKVVLLSPSGNVYNQNKAKTYSELNHLILVCGHYEGVDQRFIDKLIDEEISIGDYILTGGEIPALVVIDSVTRLIRGVLGKKEATSKESFEGNLLEHPHYTRPNLFEGLSVPDALLSGDHRKIEEWRKQKSMEKTKKIRPDLLKRK